MEDIPSKDFLVERTKFVYNEGSLHDVTFIINYKGIQNRFKAHKLILSISSPVFRAMFYGPMAEQDEVTVTDILPDAFEALLRYLYTDQVVIKDFSTAIHLHYASKKYSLPYLEKQSNEYLCNNEVDPDKACDVFQDALILEAPTVVLKCLQLFEKETVKVIASKGFLTAHQSTVQIIAQRENLNLQREYQLFSAVRSWAGLHHLRLKKKWTAQNFKILCKNIIPHIRFLTMSADEIVAVLETKLFTPEEMNPILCRIIKSNTTIPISDSFSTVRKRSNEDHKFSFCATSDLSHCVESAEDISSSQYVDNNAYRYQSIQGWSRGSAYDDSAKYIDLDTNEDVKEYDIISFIIKMLKGSIFIYKISLSTFSPIYGLKEIQSTLRNISSKDEVSKKISEISNPFSELSFDTHPILISHREGLNIRLACKSVAKNTDGLDIISASVPVDITQKNETFTLTLQQGSYFFPFKSLTVFYTPYFYNE